MIPEQISSLNRLEFISQPSLTYKLDFDKRRIGGKIDNMDATTQAVMKILYTERYAYVIYSSQYGVELERLIGKDYDFIISDLQRTITEAVLADDRMISVTEFKITKTGIDTLTASFTVNSIFGQANITVGVTV